MPKEDNKILKYIHGEKSMKHRFTIYADLECLPKKMDTCHNNPIKSSKNMNIKLLVIHCFHIVHLS